MSARPWYKRFPSDFITGTISLTLEEAGAYSYIIDLIHDRGGPIPDDPQWIARVCGCSTRKWKVIRERLIQAGKINENDGLILEKRAVNDAENSAKEGRKFAESGAKGGRKSHEIKAPSSENNDLTKNRLKQSRSHIPEARVEEATPLPEKNKTDLAVEIIRAFDKARVNAWDEEHARPYPGAKDLVIAGRLVEAGADLKLCDWVFRARMFDMAADGKDPPGFTYFEKAVLSEVEARKRGSGKTAGVLGKKGARHPDWEENRDAARLKEFQENGTWLDDWGPRPDDEDLLDIPSFLRRGAEA